MRNKHEIIGHLGADPELRSTTKGTPVARFRVATTEFWKNGQGERQTRTQWFTVLAWGPKSKIAMDLLKTGTKVLIEGPMKSREYLKDGQKHEAWELHADEILKLDRLEKDHAPEAERPAAEASEASDDIPF